MAAARRPYSRTTLQQKRLPADNATDYACFMGDLLSGRIKATALIETKDGRGRIIGMQFDDPTGVGVPPDEAAAKLAKR